MKNYTSILLILGIIVMANLVSRQYFFRMDMTQDKQFTLSNATRNILSELENPITVTAYFSEDIPQQFQKTKKDFQETLIEYSTRSKGMLDYVFVDPAESPEREQEAAQNGIQPRLAQVREKDQMSSQKVFMGAVLEMGDQKEVIPFIMPNSPIEYPMSTAIKKLSVLDKPSVGIVNGYGCPTLTDLQAAYQSLSILYNVENVDLASETSIPDRFKAVALIAPKDSIPAIHLAKLDDYLSRGGNLLIGANAVDGNLQNAQGTILTTGLETWLRNKGIEVNPSFVIDASAGSVTIQQRQGFFNVQTPVKFPFLPLVNKFADHPITKGLEQVVMPFASNITYTGSSENTWMPLAFSSEQSGIVPPPTFFDVVNKKWTAADFPQSNLVLGGVLSGNLVGNVASNIVVFGDGDFPLQGRDVQSDNVSLMVNSIDWLSDDTGLIELRTKGVASRPIDELEEDRRTFLKYLNFGLPIILVIAYGFFRKQRTRNLRMKRMSERYA